MIFDLPTFTLLHVVISVVGVICGLVVLGGLTAGARLARGWPTTYVVTAIVAIYLNVFVLVVQLFAKTPALAQLAPTQQEPPFALTQAFVLVLFVWLGWAAVRGFRAAR